MSKRTYNSTVRKDRAKKTRSQVLAAAKELLETKGFDLVTIENIAESAGVSVPTVYGLFQSKRGILKAILDEAVSHEEYETLIQKGFAETSPAKQVANAATISRRLYDAERAQINLLRGVSVLDSSFKELEQEREERRYLRQEKSLTDFAKKVGLAKGLSLSKARDILWAFTGRDLYRMLVIERGWSSDEYEKWLAEVLVKLLLE